MKRAFAGIAAALWLLSGAAALAEETPSLLQADQLESQARELSRRKDLVAALERIDAALALRRALYADSPEDRDSRMALAQDLERRGKLLTRLGRIEAALATLGEGRALVDAWSAGPDRRWWERMAPRFERAIAEARDRRR